MLLSNVTEIIANEHNQGFTASSTMLFYAKVAAPLAALNFILFLAEVIFSSVLKKDGKYTIKDTFANVGSYSFLVILNKLFITGAVIAAFCWAYEMTPLRLPLDSPIVWLAGLIFADFCYYWYHRVGHEMRFLWNMHSAHHSSKLYNMSTSARLPLFGTAVHLPFFIFMPLIGFHPYIVVTMYAVVFAYQGWLHTEYIGKLPAWAEKVFVTPSHHRAHHGRNKIYHDINYGGVFIVFDKFFGTFVPEGEKVEYGISDPLNSHNIFKIWFRDLWHTLRLAASQTTLSNRILIFLKRPGWEPKKHKSPM